MAKKPKLSLGYVHYYKPCSFIDKNPNLTMPNTLSDATLKSPIVYLGTGGYSDTDLLGTLYPKGTKKADFLTHYAKHYGAVEINSTFYAPVGQKAFAGMLKKADGRLRFAVKLHQDFTHARSASKEHALRFIEALKPIIEADALACLLLQFPHGFERSVAHRQYLTTVTDWFADYPLAIEFRHQSWHNAQVEHSFRQRNLVWCSVDYPKVNGLPLSRLLLTQNRPNDAQSKPQSFTHENNNGTLNQTDKPLPRLGYLRMHGNNLNWWDAHSASERHDYRYSDEELQGWAQTIHHQRQHFDELYVFLQNTVNSHSYYNIATLRSMLTALGFDVR